MWPTLTAIAVVAALVIHFWWKKRLIAIAAEHSAQVKRLKDEQKDLSEKYQAQQGALLNSMTEGLLVLDHEGRIQVTNRALLHLFKISGSIAGQTILEAFRLHTLDEIVQRLSHERQVLDLELEIPGLQSRCVQVNAAAILDDENKRLGAVLVFHDLTRLKQLENTRQEFVANVSHELRTPLSMIKGYAETLLHGAMNDPEVSARFLNTIDKHADRLAMIIDDLLTISQLEGGKLTLNLQPVDLNQAVLSVIEDLEARADEHRILLKNEVAPGIIVNADQARLKQVLWNLVENAIKYGKGQGNVWIGAEKVNDKQVHILVRDDGPGIPSEALPRIFERFYRVDKARSREAGGTGLGLSIVKHIIQSHGGRVWVESEIGVGSKFYFLLNLAE